MAPFLPLLVTTVLSAGGGVVEGGRSGPEEVEAERSPEPGVSATASGDATGAASGDATGASGEAEGQPIPWIRRYPPARGLIELGVMGGVYLPGANHELFEPDLDLPEQGFRGLATVAPEVGVRVSYLPFRILGFEAEGAVMPSRTDTDAAATLWTVRAGMIGQLGRWSVTPFAVLGFGVLAVSSPREALGNDVDPSLYFGGGLKVNLSRRLQLRLDLRDVVSHKRALSETFQNHNFEALLSFVVVLGRPKPPPPAPRDTDGDGFLDVDDACVEEPGVAPDGCPIGDRDGDGFLDTEDACVEEPGVAPDGCPVRDQDGDGFLDDVDACPEEAGVEPDGCPIGDRDGDGFLDPADACVDEPETTNGFEDEDGCPDEVPDELAEFSGVITGIQFEVNKAKIRPKSLPILDSAVEVLTKYPSIHVEISGHTDSRGPAAHNLTLSQARADAVRDYLVGKGIAHARIQTRGAGPHEPIASNRTAQGRAENRRIEFKILRK